MPIPQGGLSHGRARRLQLGRFRSHQSRRPGRRQANLWEAESGRPAGFSPGRACLGRLSKPGMPPRGAQDAQNWLFCLHRPGRHGYQLRPRRQGGGDLALLRRCPFPARTYDRSPAQ